MNATMIRQTAISVASGAPDAMRATSLTSEPGEVSGVPRLLLRLEGGVALVSATVAYSNLVSSGGAVGGRWTLFALLFLLPDLSMLGYLAGPRVGAACYNAAHSYLGPVLLAALSLASDARAVLCIALIWEAHVGFDRLLGYGLKYGTSFGDTHLGRHRSSTRSPLGGASVAKGNAGETYRAVMLARLSRHGRRSPSDVLEVRDLPVQEPGPGELRVRVRAAGVGSTDLMILTGSYLYAPKHPFVPGYEIAGVVDAVGPGVEGFRAGQRVAALTVYGGFGEMLVRDAARFLPIPDAVSDRDAAAVILNYVTAYQAIHRVGRVQAGQTALVTGAAGGVGTAAVQLLRLAGVKVYGAASARKHATLRALGAMPIDYRAGRLDRLVRALEPEGVDLVLDGIGGALVGACIGALRRGGRLVAYGFMGATGRISTAMMFANIFLGSRLRGRRGSFYGITALYRKDPEPFRQDLPKIFALLAEGKIAPIVARTFPLLHAGEALELLGTGTVEGKIVLEASTG